MDQFLIGNILLEIDYAGVPVISEGKLQRFRYDGPWEGERALLKCVCEPLAPYTTTPFIRDNIVYGIYQHRSEPLLIYRWGNQFNAFAVWPERFSVSLDPVMYHQPALREDWFFSICSFHRQLLNRKGCILHASYVDIGGEAVLFTGPSGMGKSTQAALWADYAGAEIINGDRALLRLLDGKWTAFGYPSCGTSGICLNRTLPIRAIVVLAQDSENAVEALSAAGKIKSLVSSTEIYPWHSKEFDMALDIATEIAAQVPVVKLRCRPDADAVNTLKHYLEGLQNHDVI